MWVPKLRGPVGRAECAQGRVAIRSRTTAVSEWTAAVRAGCGGPFVTPVARMVPPTIVGKRAMMSGQAAARTFTSPP